LKLTIFPAKGDRMVSHLPSHLILVVEVILYIPTI
jgi:hypothetical protein